MRQDNTPADTSQVGVTAVAELGRVLDSPYSSDLTPSHVIPFLKPKKNSGDNTLSVDQHLD